MRRTVMILGIQKTITRMMLELDVTANNKHLKPVVNRMSNIKLLQRSHPLYREDFAKQLQKEGQLSESRLKFLIQTWNKNKSKSNAFFTNKKLS